MYQKAGQTGCLRIPLGKRAPGLVWIAARIAYFIGYVSEARKRFPGFVIQSSVAALLLVGAFGRIAYLAWFAPAVP